MGTDQIYTGNFDEMIKSARQKLSGRSPEDLSAACGFTYDAAAGVFSFISLGTDTTVSWPDLVFEPKTDVWQELTILQYMDAASGTEMTGEDISLKEFRVGGMIRGAYFDAQCDGIAKRSLGKADMEAVAKAGLMLGGIKCGGIADLNMEFIFMPHFRFKMCLWPSDDEFPAQCRVLCDSTAEKYLNVEAAGLMAVRLLEMLEEKLK